MFQSTRENHQGAKQIEILVYVGKNNDTLHQDVEMSAGHFNRNSLHIYRNEKRS
jgi:hypothetical protein